MDLIEEELVEAKETIKQLEAKIEKAVEMANAKRLPDERGVMIPPTHQYRIICMLDVLTKEPFYQDDPELDGTDFAHPAWWRGHDSGVYGAINHLMKEWRKGGEERLLTRMDEILRNQPKENKDTSWEKYLESFGDPDEIPF